MKALGTKPLIIFSMILSSLAISCSDEAANQSMTGQRTAVQSKQSKSNVVSAETIANMGDHDQAGHSEKASSLASEKPCQNCASVEIGLRADDLPAPLNRQEPQLVAVDLYTNELIAEIMPDVTYQYWTYNDQVPGPFIRVRAGDQVEIRLSHGKPGSAHASHDQHAGGDHAAAGHSTHSIDLHAVIGPGGGAPLMQVSQGETKRFRFTATRPGIYVYHCASPHVPTHIANGMYGLILVEPAGGLAKVDREFYVMQGELYTEGKFGDKGLQSFSKVKLLTEKPEYFLFNGRIGSLTGDRALKAKVGEKIRLFVGVGSHIASNFHIIGGIFDKLYLEGALTNSPLQNVQTTVIAPGSAVMIEFTAEVPGKYLLVDHSLTRSIDKGALAELIVDGPDQPGLYAPVS